MVWSQRKNVRDPSSYQGGFLIQNESAKPTERHTNARNMGIRGKNAISSKTDSGVDPPQLLNPKQLTSSKAKRHVCTSDASIASLPKVTPQQLRHSSKYDWLPKFYFKANGTRPLPPIDIFPLSKNNEAAAGDVDCFGTNKLGQKAITGDEVDPAKPHSKEYPGKLLGHSEVDGKPFYKLEGKPLLLPPTKPSSKPNLNTRTHPAQHQQQVKKGADAEDDDVDGIFLTSIKQNNDYGVTREYDYSAVNDYDGSHSVDDNSILSVKDGYSVDAKKSSSSSDDPSVYVDARGTSSTDASVTGVKDWEPHEAESMLSEIYDLGEVCICCKEDGCICNLEDKMHSDKGKVSDVADGVRAPPPPPPPPPPPLPQKSRQEKKKDEDINNPRSMDTAQQKLSEEQPLAQSGGNDIPSIKAQLLGQGMSTDLHFLQSNNLTSTVDPVLDMKYLRRKNNKLSDRVICKRRFSPYSQGTDVDPVRVGNEDPDEDSSTARGSLGFNQFGHEVDPVSSELPNSSYFSDSKSDNPAGQFKFNFSSFSTYNVVENQPSSAVDSSEVEMQSAVDMASSDVDVELNTLSSAVDSLVPSSSLISEAKSFVSASEMRTPLPSVELDDSAATKSVSAIDSAADGAAFSKSYILGSEKSATSPVQNDEIVDNNNDDKSTDTLSSETLKVSNSEVKSEVSTPRLKFVASDIPVSSPIGANIVTLACGRVADIQKTLSRLGSENDLQSLPIKSGISKSSAVDSDNTIDSAISHVSDCNLEHLRRSSALKAEFLAAERTISSHVDSNIVKVAADETALNEKVGRALWFKAKTIESATEAPEIFTSRASVSSTVDTESGTVDGGTVDSGRAVPSTPKIVTTPRSERQPAPSPLTNLFKFSKDTCDDGDSTDAVMDSSERSRLAVAELADDGLPGTFSTARKCYSTPDCGRSVDDDDSVDFDNDDSVDNSPHATTGKSHSSCNSKTRLSKIPKRISKAGEEQSSEELRQDYDTNPIGDVATKPSGDESKVSGDDTNKTVEGDVTKTLDLDGTYEPASGENENKTVAVMEVSDGMAELCPSVDTSPIISEKNKVKITIANIEASNATSTTIKPYVPQLITFTKHKDVKAATTIPPPVPAKKPLPKLKTPLLPPWNCSTAVEKTSLYSRPPPLTSKRPSSSLSTAVVSTVTSKHSFTVAKTTDSLERIASILCESPSNDKTEDGDSKTDSKNASKHSSSLSVSGFSKSFNKKSPFVHNKPFVPVGSGSNDGRKKIPAKNSERCIPELRVPGVRVEVPVVYPSMVYSLSTSETSSATTRPMKSGSGRKRTYDNDTDEEDGGSAMEDEFVELPCILSPESDYLYHSTPLVGGNENNSESEDLNLPATTESSRDKNCNSAAGSPNSGAGHPNSPVGNVNISKYGQCLIYPKAKIYKLDTKSLLWHDILSENIGQMVKSKFPPSIARSRSPSPRPIAFKPPPSSLLMSKIRPPSPIPYKGKRQQARGPFTYRHSHGAGRGGRKTRTLGTLRTSGVPFEHLMPMVVEPMVVKQPYVLPSLCTQHAQQFQGRGDVMPASTINRGPLPTENFTTVRYELKRLSQAKHE